MGYDYDLIVIGLGPAGMAVSIMGSEMGLKVCAIEKHRIGGECMNVGCIPSKALLRFAKTRHAVTKFAGMMMAETPAPAVGDIFGKIQEHLAYISEKKTMGMFKRVELHLGEGAASFVDPHTVEAGGRRFTAKRIFIATGTRPQILPVPGLAESDPLTNETIFSLPKIPESLIVLGGGAIACEMAQAFQRLGSEVTLIQRSEHILSMGEPEAALVLEEALRAEGVNLLTGRTAKRVDFADGRYTLITSHDETITGDRLLAASGRMYDTADLKLGNAGVETNERGAIRVDDCLRTTAGHIYAVGDCNGHFLLSHAAMHQGMIALMNSMTPWPFKQRFTKFVVPWTVFTEPAVSHAGALEKELKEKGVTYEVVTTRYGDFGAAIAEHVEAGFIRALVGPWGRILGVDIVGEGSGEMINEWALAIQKGMRMTDLMLLQHSFPTMGFLTKRSSENWMMGKMESETLRRLCRFMFRL